MQTTGNRFDLPMTALRLAFLCAVVGCSSSSSDYADSPDVSEADVRSGSDGRGADEPEDPASPEEIVKIPCLTPSVDAVDFGVLEVGSSQTKTIEFLSCGLVPVEVYSVSIVSISGGEFAATVVTPTPPPSPDVPVLLSPGLMMRVEVDFSAIAGLKISTAGEVLANTAELVIETNAVAPALKLPLAGSGVQPECQGLQILGNTGVLVQAETALIMRGEFSSTPDWIDQVNWHWQVDQPLGSEAVFLPSPGVNEVTFVPVLLGTYVFRLLTVDAAGAGLCHPVERTIVVSEFADIQVELTWDTPGDPDQMNTGPEAGADLDLHFVHPWAAGPDLDGDGQPEGWYDIPFDCFWFNTNPNWGSFDPAIDDNPHLVQADSDGMGPEIMTLSNPEKVIYKVGVHYWSDHDYGNSFATIQIRLGGVVALEIEDVELVDSDMWEVCVIDMTSGTVTAIVGESGEYKITPQYKNPYFFE